LEERQRLNKAKPECFQSDKGVADMSVGIAQLEHRLAAVEAALTQVQHKLGLATPAANWVEAVSRSLADILEEDYQLFLDCCRAVRNGEPL
jgi:hypothetical protein